MKTIGIVGCGAIGKGLLKAFDAGAVAADACVTSRTESSCRDFLQTLGTPVRFLALDELIARSDIVVEAAGGAVVPELARQVFDAGKDLMVISVGALLDHPEIIERGAADRLPSAAALRRHRGARRHQVRVRRRGCPRDHHHPKAAPWTRGRSVSGRE